MNANEMADDCESYAEGKYLYPWDRLMEVSTMLRQQQTTIEQYEKSTDYWMKLCQEANSKIEMYIEALDRLARLGNGDNYGNSIGNDIAIDALRKAQEK